MFPPVRSIRPAALASLLLASTVSALAGPAYSPPQAFSRPGFTIAQPWDINSAGHIVGQSRTDTVAEGFLYAGGVFTTLLPPGADNSTITGISDTGVVVGAYFTDVSGGSLSASFIHENGSFASFSLPGANNVTVRRISANGRYLTGTYSGPGISSRGFAYDRQTATHRDIVANSGSVIAQGITSQGVVSGGVIGPSTYAFTFDMGSGVMTAYSGADLGSRPRFRDINDSGLITGSSASGAFVGRPGDWTFFSTPPGMVAAFGYGLNNAGDLMGYFQDGSGSIHGWTASPVPEPAAWALLAGGLALLAWRRRAA